LNGRGYLQPVLAQESRFGLPKIPTPPCNFPVYIVTRGNADVSSLSQLIDKDRAAADTGSDVNKLSVADKDVQRRRS